MIEPYGTVPRLASESVVVAAPMSFAGATGRTRNVIRRVHGHIALRVSLISGLVVLLVLWWALILCWYAIFGLLLVPYRIFRRGQRKRELAAQRHREVMAGLRGQPPR